MLPQAHGESFRYEFAERVDKANRPVVLGMFSRCVFRIRTIIAPFILSSGPARCS